MSEDNGSHKQRIPDVGAYIRDQRRKAQLSLRKLAERSGVSNPYLSQIERGLRRPSAEILQQIAKGLRISAEALYVQAGILEDRRPDSGVRAAVLADPDLAERQKQVLLEIYESFRRETALNAEAAAGAELVTKDELFRQSDIVTIHVILSERTRGLVGAAELALMKPTARLVNTSRGPIVNEQALIEALRARAIAGAAVDVFDTEPLPAKHPFRSLENLLATPHIGFVAEDLYRTFYGDAAAAIAAWIEKLAPGP